MAIKLDIAMKQISKSLDEFATKRKMGIWAREYARLIGKRTRLGKGVDENNSPQKSLKKLTSKKYIRQRFLDKKRGGLSAQTRPAKSNLTRTGELLNSLTGKGLGTRKATIYPVGKRNEKVTKWQEDQGRTYLRLSRPEINKLTRQIGQELEKYIKRALS